MKCILHIGCEKTGTTSIQKFAADNRSLLANNNIQLLKSTGFPNATALAIACMDYLRKDHNTDRHGISDNIELRSKWCTTVTENIVKELSAIKNPSSSVLISAEYLSSKLHTVDEVQRVKDILDKGGITQTTVVVYLRRQLEFAISRQSTAIKSALANSGSVDLESILNLRPGDILLDYEKLLMRWEAVFGGSNVIVRVFDEKELLQNDINFDFYSHACRLTFERKENQQQVRENRSLSALAQTCLAQLKTHLDDSLSDSKSIAHTMKTAVSYLSKFHSGEPFLPNKQKSIKFQSNFSAGNNRIAKRWLKREILFSDDYDRYPQSTQSISANDPRLFGLLAELVTYLSNRERQKTGKEKIT